MNRKVIGLLIVVAIVAAAIEYGTMLNSQPAQPPPPNTNCRPENLTGNFTSSPEMSDLNNGPYNVTFSIQNLGTQSANITEYSDNNGLTQSVSWIVPASAAGSFSTTITKAETYLVLESSCGTIVTARYYTSPIIGDQPKHYEITLNLLLGGTAA